MIHRLTSEATTDDDGHPGVLASCPCGWRTWLPGEPGLPLYLDAANRHAWHVLHPQPGDPR